MRALKGPHRLYPVVDKLRTFSELDPETAELLTL